MPSPFSVLKQAFLSWKKDRASSLAAALAYHAIFSLTPLLIVILAIVGFVYQGSSAQDRFLSGLQGVVGREPGELIRQMLERSNVGSQSSGAFWIGTLLTLVGSIGVFKQLQESVQIIWNTSPSTGSWKALIWRHIWLFLLVVLTGILLILSLTVSTLLSSDRLGFLSDVLGFVFTVSVFHQLISLAVLGALLATLFKYLPGVHLAWRNVVFAAGFTSLLFAIGKYALGFYLGRGTVSSPYGAAGSLVALLVWIFYAAQIFLYGVEIVKVRCQALQDGSPSISSRSFKGNKEKSTFGKSSMVVLLIGIFLKIRDYTKRTA